MKEFLDYTILDFGSIRITIGAIILIGLGYAIVRILLYLFTNALKAFFIRRKIDIGRSYAVIQVVKYLAYLIFILFVLNLLGIDLKYILTGSAALLVGVGLGLQQTFNDFFSGLILLFEGTVEVQDKIMVNGKVGVVKEIGLRTSKVETRDKHIIHIPNSRLVNNEVINLTHMTTPIRFHVDLRVGYDADMDMVEKTIRKATEHLSESYISRVFPTEINVEHFGNFSVHVRFFFYTFDIMRIEMIKGVVQKVILAAFQEHKISIPFPQQDLWIHPIKDNAAPKSML